MFTSYTHPLPRPRGRPRRKPVENSNVHALEASSTKGPASTLVIDASGASQAQSRRNAVSCIVSNIFESATAKVSTSPKSDGGASRLVKLPQPATLQIHDLASIFTTAPSPESEYFASMKTDGVRCLTVLLQLPSLLLNLKKASLSDKIKTSGAKVPCVVFMNRRGRISVARVEALESAQAASFDPPTLLDGELCTFSSQESPSGEVGCKICVHVFDNALCRGKIVAQESYFRRMEIAKFLLHRLLKKKEQHLPRRAGRQPLFAPCVGNGDFQTPGPRLSVVWVPDLCDSDGPLANCAGPALPTAELAVFPKPLFDKSQCGTLVRFMGQQAPALSPPGQAVGALERLLRRFEYDGLILTPNNSPYQYRPGSLQTFKWKPASMMTVDFLLSAPEPARPFRALDIIPQSAWRFVGRPDQGVKLHTRRTGPPSYEERLATYCMYLNHDGNKFLFSYLQADAKVGCLEGKVYECLWLANQEGNAGHWHIVRPREDKKKPNALMTCISCLQAQQQNVNFGFLHTDATTT